MSENQNQNQNQNENQKLTKNQKKRARLKAKKLAEAQGIEEKGKEDVEVTTNTITTTSTTINTRTPLVPEKFTFEEERDWCILQIEKGFPRADESQKKEGQRVIKKLKSDTIPRPKQIHLMRVCFGDYKALMKKDTAWLQARLEAINKAAVNDDDVE